MHSHFTGAANFDVNRSLCVCYGYFADLSALLPRMGPPIRDISTVYEVNVVLSWKTQAGDIVIPCLLDIYKKIYGPEESDN